MRHLINSKFIALLVVLLASVLSVSAQGQGGQKKQGGFDPKKFEADMEQFITTNAGLSPQEAAKFFPVHREMMKRMRGIFDQMRHYHHVNPCDARACAEAIRKQDELDIEMKTLQQEYHSRFMLILPATKVLKIIKAEEKFHRQAFRRFKKQ